MHCKSNGRCDYFPNECSFLLENFLHQLTGFRWFPSQVNHAVSVGYARHLIAWLFSLWPKDQRITRTFLNNIDASKVVGLLDLIQEAEDKDQFEKASTRFSMIK